MIQILFALVLVYNIPDQYIDKYFGRLVFQEVLVTEIEPVLMIEKFTLLQSRYFSVLTAQRAHRWPNAAIPIDYGSVIAPECIADTKAR